MLSSQRWHNRDALAAVNNDLIKDMLKYRSCLGGYGFNNDLAFNMSRPTARIGRQRNHEKERHPEQDMNTR
jgi:hypothetical protein